LYVKLLNIVDETRKMLGRVRIYNFSWVSQTKDLFFQGRALSPSIQIQVISLYRYNNVCTKTVY